MKFWCMFFADLFYNSKIVLQKMKRNQRFSRLRVVINKLNNANFEINGRFAYFMIGNCTRELAIFLKCFKNYTLVISQF